MTETVHIYCDGACSPNPGTGGWGAVLLIDRRFSSPRYRSLLPAHWQPLRVDAARTLRAALQRFWNTAGVKEAPG